MSTGVQITLIICATLLCALGMFVYLAVHAPHNK